MSQTAENSASSVNCVRIGVATHVTPGFSLVGNEALQDLLLAVDGCVESGDFKLIIDFSAVQTIDSMSISALMDLQDRLLKLGGWVKVLGHNSMIGEIAEITGLAEAHRF